MESSRRTEILNWKWGYVILLSKFVTNMTGSGIAKSFGVLLPEMVERFQGTYATLGFICSIPGTIMLFSGPFISLVLQRVDHRLVAMLGGVMSGVCLVSCGFISNITVFGVTLALTGIGRACVYLPVALLVNEYFTENFVLLNTMASYGTTAGVMFLPVIAERSLEAYGYSGVFMILGAIMLHLVAGGAAIRKPIFRMNDQISSQDESDMDEDQKLLKDEGDEDGEKLKTGESKSTDELAKGNVQAVTGFHKTVNHERTVKESRVEGIYKEDVVSGHDDDQDDSGKEYIPLLDSSDDPGDLDKLGSSSKSIQEDSDKGALCPSFISRFKQFLMKETLFMMCLPAIFFRVYSFDAWVLFLVPHSEQLGIIPSRAVFLASIGGIGGIFGRTISVILLAKKVHMFRIYIILGLITCLTFFLDFIGKSFVIRSVWAFLQGFCFFVMDTADANFLKLTLVNEDNFSFGLGLIMFVHGSGSVSTGFLTGALFDLVQSYTIVFMITGVVVLFYTINIVVVSVLLNRRMKSSMDEST